MTLRFFVHSVAKRAKAIALIDSGATENFMNLKYAKWLQLPIKRMDEPRKLLNVDGTENKSGELCHYTNLQVHTGNNHTTLQFYITELGKKKTIPRYPLVDPAQPKLDSAQVCTDH